MFRYVERGRERQRDQERSVKKEPNTIMFVT